MEDSKSIQHWSNDDKPRERLLSKGKESLSTSELLAIILSTGTRDKTALELSREILNRSGNHLARLAELNISELCAIKGVGTAKAVSIVAALELAKRKQAQEQQVELIGSSKDVYQFFGPKLEAKAYEEFWMLMLNRRNQIIRPYRISEGGISGTVADPKKIFKAALENNACSIILCHNHPSGNLNPSGADRSLTKKLKSAASQLDIQLLDHIIVALGGYYSFADNGDL